MPDQTPHPAAQQPPAQPTTPSPPPLTRDTKPKDKDKDTKDPNNKADPNKTKEPTEITDANMQAQHEEYMEKKAANNTSPQPHRTIEQNFPTNPLNLPTETKK